MYQGHQAARLAAVATQTLVVAAEALQMEAALVLLEAVMTLCGGPLEAVYVLLEAVTTLQMEAVLVLLEAVTTLCSGPLEAVLVLLEATQAGVQPGAPEEEVSLDESDRSCLRASDASHGNCRWSPHVTAESQTIDMSAHADTVRGAVVPSKARS